MINSNVTIIKTVIPRNLLRVERDIAGLMELSGLQDKPLIYLSVPDLPDMELKEKTLKHVLDTFKENDCVIITDAYVSLNEFPNEIYTLDKQEEPDKELLPIDDVLKRESNLLEKLGFININDYIQYEYKVAFIYGNTNGKFLVEKIKN